ncbi:MAG TPA: hypothetical protein DCL95_19985, partial [Rhodospirillaceae bacterium]|nr:hypothetical protein [Rhodospirillaceae bacterium]
MDLFEAVAQRIAEAATKRTLIAASGEGARERLKLLIREGGVADLSDANMFAVNLAGADLTGCNLSGAK